MKASKNRKLAKKDKHVANVKRKKEMKVERLAKIEKYNNWLNLPEDQWLDARKKYIPVKTNQED